MSAPRSGVFIPRHYDPGMATFADTLKLLAFRIATSGGATALSKTVFAPLDRIKILRQVQPMNNVPATYHYKGLLDGVVGIWRREGFLALWRGNGANVARVVPEVLLKYSVNDQFKIIFAPTDGRPLGVPGKLAAGTATGVLKTVLLYPLEVVRVRLTADPSRLAEARLYRGMLHCVLQTLRQEGLFGLYKGMTLSLVGVAPNLAISLTTYDELKERLLPTERESKGSWWYPFLTMGVGAASAVVAQTLTYPLDTVRRRMQLNGAVGQRITYRSYLDCFRRMVREEGIRSFYRGCGVNALRLAPAQGLSFVTYDFIRISLLAVDPSLATASAL